MNYQQILTFIHKFVLHTNGSKVDAYSIPELVFFLEILGAKRGTDNAQIWVIYGCLCY